jgi:hypothetical protein
MIFTTRRWKRYDRNPRRGVLWTGFTSVETNLAIKFLAGIIKRARPTTPHLLTMQRNREYRRSGQRCVGQKIDAGRARQRVPPSRFAAIVHILEHDPQHQTPPGKKLLSRSDPPDKAQH